MRLIDADALREIMFHRAFEEDSDMRRWYSGCWIRYKMFEQAIEETQTIDAEPVRHGRWEWHEDEYICNCSKCDFEIDVYGCIDPYRSVGIYKYCPNCGARMDKEENDG